VLDVNDGKALLITSHIIDTAIFAVGLTPCFTIPPLRLTKWKK
jgi:hypothetical protein